MHRISFEPTSTILRQTMLQSYGRGMLVLGMRCKGIVQRRGWPMRVASAGKRRVATRIEVARSAEQRSSVLVGPLYGVRRCGAQALRRKIVACAGVEPHRGGLTRCARLPAPRSAGTHAGVGGFVARLRPGRVSSHALPSASCSTGPCNLLGGGVGLSPDPQLRSGTHERTPAPGILSA